MRYSSILHSFGSARTTPVAPRSFAWRVGNDAILPSPSCLWGLASKSWKGTRWQQVVAAALLAGACAPFSTTTSLAQAVPPQDRPVLLDRKTAERLLVDNPKPGYPPLAHDNYIQGHVRIRILVNQEGQVAEAHVLRGHPLLAAAALINLHRWRYAPYRTSAGPRDFVTDVEVVFNLRIKDLKSMPTQPEVDFARQVRPPQVLSQPASAGRPDNLPQASSIHIRVLVSEGGKALDVDPAPAFPAKFEGMRQHFAAWTFQPARFGSLAVPWYLEVQVPSEDWPAANGIPGGF